MKTRTDVTLFKGGGEGNAREKVISHFSRTGILSRLFPNRYLYARYLLEFGSYGVALAPHLAFGNFDLVHFIDPPLARLLHAGRRLCGGRYRLIFTNARPRSFDCFQWADHVHCINPEAVEEARQAGIDERRFSLIPVGLDAARLDCSASRADLRRKYGVPDGMRVVLSVTALNRAHKRVDYLIEETAAAGGKLLLWLDGGLHPDGDPSLLTLASEKLGDRFRHTHVPSDQVGELLRMADVFVSSAMVESFGMAIVEAMSCGLPVITHDSAHFRWLTGGLARFVDQSAAGNLTACLREWMDLPESWYDPVELKAAARRFAWENISSDHLRMYERALEFPQKGRPKWAASYNGRTL
jgi:glycosyltransferase involved in cell wall biosynthesis